MPIKLTGDWAKARALKDVVSKALEVSLAREADLLGENMRAGIASGHPGGTTLAPLHPLTAALKGSSIPLAGMERWIQIKKIDRFHYFIGMVDPEGAWIGAIHEEGRTWTQVWTERQRRWFFSQLARFGLLDRSAPRGSTGGNGEVTHVIPPRPWLQPTADQQLPAARQRISADVIKAVLG